MPDGHDHRWTRLVLHGDACHFTTDILECQCGARARASTERDMRADPLEASWFRDDCARCLALDAGAEPTATLTVIKDGRHAIPH